MLAAAAVALVTMTVSEKKINLPRWILNYPAKVQHAKDLGGNFLVPISPI